MKVGIEPSVWSGGSCNLFPIVHSALRLPLYSFLVNPSLSSLICVSFSLPHSSSPSIHFTFSVHPSIHPLAHSSSPCVSTLSLSASVHPPSPSLFHPCGTYQRQGNLICSAVRRTLTELNVWFPFISVHLTNALPPPPFVSIDFNRRISRGEKKKTVDSSISQRMVNFLSVSCYSPTL